MSNLNGLFRQFVSTIANSAGGFVNAFDDSKDGIVLKAEFQANMAQNKADWVNNWNGEAGKYNDLVDSFWNSFDNIYKKGEIYDTNIQNAYALDRTESGKVQKQMDVFFKVNQLFDEALKGKLTFLSKYPEISNYIKGEVANNIIDNNIDDAENLNLNDLLNRINNVINSNADSIKNILLQDLLKNGSLNFNYTAVDGYNPLNDANLMTIINSSITGFSGGIEGLKEYLNSGLNNEIEKISERANEYLSDDAKLDPNNNYQIARLAAIYFEQAKNLIPSDLDGRLKEKALAKARETANEAAKEILSNNGNANLTLRNACGETTGKFIFNYTLSGIRFNDYVKALSNGDFNANEDDALYNELVMLLQSEAGLSEQEAKTVAKYLADNDKDLADFQALVESVAEKVFATVGSGVPYNKLIAQEIVNGKMGNSDTTWLTYLQEHCAGVKWLFDKLSIQPNSTKTYDIVSLNNIENATYKVSISSQQEDLDIDAEIDNNGVLTIKSNNNKAGMFSINVEVVVDGNVVSSKTIDVYVSAQDPLEGTEKLLTIDDNDMPINTCNNVYTDGGQSYKFSTKSKVQEHAKGAVNSYVDTIYNELVNKDKYDITKLVSAMKKTKEYFDALIDAIKVGNKNNYHNNWKTENSEFRDPDGNKVEFDYDVASRADRWRLNDMVNAKDIEDVALITDSDDATSRIFISKDFIERIFIQYYESA